MSNSPPIAKGLFEKPWNVESLWCPATFHITMACLFERNSTNLKEFPHSVIIFHAPTFRPRPSEAHMDRSRRRLQCNFKTPWNSIGSRCLTFNKRLQTLLFICTQSMSMLLKFNLIPIQPGKSDLVHVHIKSNILHRIFDSHHLVTKKKGKKIYT